MEKIFKDTNFGDKFLTKSGEIALLIHNQNSCIFTCRIDGIPPIDIEYYPDGTRKDNGFYMLDIVSKYKEPIDEEELDELALTEYGEEWAIGISKDEYSLSHETNLQIKAFKAGYRKAKEE